MNSYKIMLKTNLKLLLRNKFTFVLMFLIPLLAPLVLNIPVNPDYLENQIKLSVCIIDTSKSQLSQILIERLKDDESLIVTCKEDNIPALDELDAFLIDTANHTSIRTYIYIPSDFEDKVLSGEIKNLITLYDSGHDQRTDLLKGSLQSVFSRFYLYSNVSRGDSKSFYALLNSANSDKTQKEVVTLQSSSNMLTYNASPKVEPIRYLIAIICAAIFFGSVSIISIFIKEKENLVLKRITLSPAHPITYIGVKLSLGIISLIIQIGVMMLSIKTFTHLSMDISLLHMGLLILGLGLVFLSMSVCLGICLDSIDKVNYFALCIIVLSSMLAGLYFPIELSPKWMQNIALLFPQRWFIYTVDQLILGHTNVLYLYFSVAFGFVIFFISLALLGYKMNNKVNL
jgi:ABC-2 type transport system permease protein